MGEDRKPRILVTYVEAGHGHIVAAEAISAALARRYGDECELIERHILRESEQKHLRRFERFLVRQVYGYSKNPLIGRLEIAAMRLFGASSTLRLLHGTVFRRAVRLTVEEYRMLRPDVIVSTHYFTALAAVEYRNRYAPECRVAVYCPDNNVHGWWDNRVDVLYTNNIRATVDAQHYGFPRERIVEVFYPTRPAVSESRGCREEYRERFGIPTDRFAVAVADGIYARAKARRVTKALLRTRIPLTVCLLAGKNERLAESFARRRAPRNVKLIVFGFTPDAPQIYAACDLLITKAGPNAVLDSVMMGTPVIVDYFATPIERATKEIFVDECGCGLYVRSARRIRRTVERLANDSVQMARLKAALGYFDKDKNGAGEIADDIISRFKK